MIAVSKKRECRSWNHRLLQLAIISSLITSACAPEPTTPADTNLGGVWTANANLFTLSSLRMNITQEPRGIVSGGWTARGAGGGGGCLPSTPCNASGQLIGRNTVATVEIELLGAGRFEGVLAQPNRLRGIFAVSLDYDTITFVRQQTVLPLTSR